MTSASSDGVRCNALSLSAEQRLRVLRTLHVRLLRFPERDEVLADLLARWPKLFTGTTVLEQLAHAASSTATVPPEKGTSADPSGHDEPLVAARAALAAAEHEIEVLQQALPSNRTIGTAVGVLMANRRITEQRAFDLLRDASMRSNRKLRHIAAEVVFTGTLPKPFRETPSMRRADDVELQDGTS